MRIAIQGYEGSFHEIAARNYFGQAIIIVPCATFREVARKVEEGEADYGLMAIENSIAGSIIANYSILQNSHLQVAGEVYLHIRQNLMALPGTSLDDIQEVHSHPMALLQCVDFLDNYDWKLVETEDTALSAKEIRDQNLKNTAAIAGDLAADLFGLTILAPAINTIKDNQTRFMVLKRKDDIIDPLANKASLYFKTDHTQGSLLKVLRQMEDSSINMTKLQSYPIPSEPWHYLFHVDMEFEALDDYDHIMERLRRAAPEVHVYGVYRRGLESHNTPNKQSHA